jgi:hypothetical protein
MRASEARSLEIADTLRGWSNHVGANATTCCRRARAPPPPGLPPPCDGSFAHHPAGHRGKPADGAPLRHTVRERRRKKTTSRAFSGPTRLRVRGNATSALARRANFLPKISRSHDLNRLFWKEFFFSSIAFESPQWIFAAIVLATWPRFPSAARDVLGRLYTAMPTGSNLCGSDNGREHWLRAGW